MTQVRSAIRGQIRSPIRGPMTRKKGSGESFHDGISFDAATGRVVLKAVGGAPTITSLTSAFTFTGGNQSLFMGPAGLLIPSATNTPRIEFDAGGTCKGLLMEAARTNLCLQSADFATTWTTSSSSVSANTAAAPDGTAAADKMVEAAATARHFVAQSITKAASSITYAVSGWFKAAERTFGSIRVSDGPQTGDARVNINLTTGAAGSTVLSGVGFTSASASVQTGPSGWYRLILVFTSSADTTLRVEFGADTDNDATALSYAGDGTSGLHLWGAQVEVGAFPSSYIPTTTVAVDRTADSCIRTLGSEFSATAGTVAVTGFASGGQDASVGQIIWAFDDGTTANPTRLLRPAASDTARFVVVSAATLDSTFTNSTLFKSGSGWALDNFATSFNGGAVLTDTLGAVSPGLLTLGIGCGATGTQMNGHIRKFDYWPTRLANATLQQLST